MAATARGFWSRRLLFACIFCLLSPADSAKYVTLSGSKPQNFDLGPPGKDYNETKLELFGRTASEVGSVDITLFFAGEKQRTDKLRPPPTEKVSGSLGWTICGSSSASAASVKINWREPDDTLMNITAKVMKTDTRYKNEPRWKVESTAWEYKRLPPPAGNGSTAAVWISSPDTVAATACFRTECQDVITLTPEAKGCRTFTKTASFKFHDGESVPEFLYMRLSHPADSPHGKEIAVQAIRGSHKDIKDWLSKKPNPASSSPPNKSSSSSSRGQQAAGSGRAASPRKAIHRSGTEHGRQHGTRTAPAAPPKLPGSAGARPRPGQPSDQGGAKNADTVSNHAQASNGEGMSQSVSLTDVMSPNVEVNYNIGALPGQLLPASRPKPQPEAQPATAPPPEPEPEPAGRDDVSGVVTGSEPRTLQLNGAPWKPEDGPLTLEVDSDGALFALVMLEPEPQILHISSATGGSGRLQLCPRQLPAGGRLPVTFSTTGSDPVGFSARLQQSTDRLSVTTPKEVALSQNQSGRVSQLEFPDFDSPVGLSVHTPPQTCLRASLFDKMCTALTGKLKDAILHKYLSGNDYLPIANPFTHRRRAFLRTDWAAPEQCGLPARSGGPLQALLTLNRHQESDAWVLVLVPPLTLALVLPALVLWMVRAAAARWRRRPLTGEDGVTISELPETPRLPRHVPTLTGDTAKPSLPTTTSAAANATGAAGTAAVSSEAGCSDLPEEDRGMVGAGAVHPDRQVAGPGPVYPDLSVQQRRELAEAEGEEKERLAERLGIGGQPALPSAPAGVQETELSVSVPPAGDRSEDPADVSLLPATPPAASAAALLLPQPGPEAAGGPALPAGLPASALCGCGVAVLSTTAYSAGTALQAFLSGDAGACPVSAHYTVISARLPAVGGLANLIPTLACAVCLWLLRGLWTRHAAPGLLRRGVVWPAPGVEWLLLLHGVQGAVGGLCPGHSPCFTPNTFAVALLALLATTRAPSVRPSLPLAATVAGSALLSASDWLPGQGLWAAAAAAVLQGFAVSALYWRMMPRGGGDLPLLQRLRALAASRLPGPACLQLLTCLLGLLVLSPAGYLAMAALVTLITAQWVTRPEKGSVCVRTPFSPYSCLAVAVGCLAFCAAVILGELAHAGRLDLLEASSIGQLLYLTACLALALGISPRPLRLQ